MLHKAACGWRDEERVKAIGVSVGQVGCRWRARYRQGKRLASNVVNKACFVPPRRQNSIPRHAASGQLGRAQRIESYPDMTCDNNAALCDDCRLAPGRQRSRRSGRRRGRSSSGFLLTATDGDGQIRLTAAWHSRHKARSPAAILPACLSTETDLLTSTSAHWNVETSWRCALW